MDFVYGSGQIVGVEQFYTYFTYVTIYVVNVGIIFLLAPYMILREDYMISKFKALPKLVESDHCPIKFHILNSKLKELSSAEMNIHINDSSPCSDVYIWQDERKI